MDGEKLIDAVREKRCLWVVSNSDTKIEGGGKMPGKTVATQVRFSIY